MKIKGLKETKYSENGFTLQMLKKDEIKEIKDEIALSLISRDCAVSVSEKQESILLSSLSYAEKKEFLKFVEAKTSKVAELENNKQETITKYLSELENIDEYIKEFQNAGNGEK